MPTPLYDRYEAHLDALRLSRGPLTSNYEEALRRLCEEERGRLIAKLRAFGDGVAGHLDDSDLTPIELAARQAFYFAADELEKDQ